MAQLLVYDAGKTLMASWLATQSVGVMLLSPSYTPQPTHRFITNVSAYEIAVQGYDRQTLAGVVASTNAVAHQGVLSADNVTWASLGAGATIGWAMLFLPGFSDAVSYLLAAIQTATIMTNGAPLTVAWNGGASAGTIYVIE